MNSRERLELSLDHKEPDQIPLDLASTPVSGISSVAYQNYLNYLGVDEGFEMFDIVQQIVTPSERFLTENGVDTRPVRSGAGSGYSLVHKEEGTYKTFVDEWGIKWRMPQSGGFYYDMATHPLEQVEDVAEVDAYKLFLNAYDDARYAGMKKKAQEIHSRGLAVVVNSIAAGIYEMLTWLMGYESSLIGLATDEQTVVRILEKVFEIKYAYWERVLDEFGDLVSVAQEADDLASQTSLIISPETYRTHIKPLHKKLFGMIHSKSKAKVFIHSCGSIRKLLPDFIDAGVDIINPVQFSAAEMEPVALKREFGKDLTFWGGGVDTQKIFPTGTPQEVAENVKRMMDILRKDGGFVFNSVHNIQADVPPANLDAYFKTFHTFKKY